MLCLHILSIFGIVRVLVRPFDVSEGTGIAYVMQQLIPNRLPVLRICYAGRLSSRGSNENVAFAKMAARIAVRRVYTRARLLEARRSVTKAGYIEHN